MTSHAFVAWNDANGPEPAAREPQPIDAAVNTLKDVFNLTTENLPSHVAIARIQTITRAALERLGVAVSDDGPAGPAEEEDAAEIAEFLLREPASGWFEDGLDTAA